MQRIAVMFNRSSTAFQMGTWMDIRRRSASIVRSCVSILSGVGRYVAKIIFTYILGYKVDIGHMEAVNLISSSKYSEKQIARLVHVLRVLLLSLDRDIWQ